MKTIRIVRGLFSLLLAAILVVYCAINLIVRWPYFKRGIQDSWDFSSFISNMLDSANGGVAFQGAIQDASGNLKLALRRKTDNLFTMAQSDNGQFIYLDFYPYVSYDFSRQALQLQQLQSAAQDLGASFLYLNAIDPYIEGLASYGSIPVANQNPRADAFLDVLHGYGVETLDSRIVLAASDLPPEEYRYHTGPYWTTQASFEVYLGLMNALKEQGVAIDEDGFYADRDHFRRTEYPNSYVGEMGKRMGITMAGYEDFTIIEPSFETDFTVNYRYTNHRATEGGDFSQVLLETHWIESENPYERNLYAAYLSGEYPLRVIQNEKNSAGPRILIVGDAYMLPVASFLATAAGEVHLLWPYTIPGTGTLVDYLNDQAFDSVIVGVAPNLLYGSGFNYLDGIEVPTPDSNAIDTPSQ